MMVKRVGMSALRSVLALLIALSVVAVIMLARGMSRLPQDEHALLVLLPALILLAIDWRGASFRDVDFALGADVAILVASSGIYAVLFVVLRRICSSLIT